MTSMTNRYYHRFCRLLTFVFAVLLFTACDNPIFDEEGDCSVVYKVRFKYDMNLKWADAFANEVKSVRVFAFDQDGKLVWQNSERGEILAAAGYTMTLDLQPGKYRLIAWCGLDNDGSRPESFTLPSLSNGDYGLDALSTRLSVDRSAGSPAESGERLWPLFHGAIDVEIQTDEETDPGVYVVTIPLTKDTNHIRVILQHLSAEDLDADDFRFEIEADNGSLDHDNNIVEGDRIRYRAWAQQSGQAGVGKEDVRSVVMVNGAIADLTVNRMMADRKDDMLLSIFDDKNNRKIATIPVIDYALLAKEYYETEYGHKMSDQEFLDREDEYTLTLFLDDDHQWLSSMIMIHSWRIVINNVDIK